MNIVSTDAYAFHLDECPTGQLLCIVEQGSTGVVTQGPDAASSVSWTKRGTMPANEDGTGVRDIFESYGPYPSRDGDGKCHIFFSGGRGIGRQAQLITIDPSPEA